MQEEGRKVRKRRKYPATCGTLFKQIDNLLLEDSGGFVDLSVQNDSGSRSGCSGVIILAQVIF